MPEPPRNPAPPKRRRFRYSLRAMFVVFVVVALVLGWFRHLLETSDRHEMGTSMYSALLAIANYDVYHGQLPRAVRVDDSGHPLSSWRFQLIIYLERFQYEAWGGFEPVLDAPWDSATNKPLADRRWTVFSKRTGGDLPETNIMAITGPGTAFDDDNPRAMEHLPEDLILLAEVRHSGIHWMAPGDLDVRTMPRTIGQANGISGISRGGFHVGFADRSVWYMRSDTPFAELEKFFTIDGAAANDREEILGPYCLERPFARSFP